MRVSERKTFFSTPLRLTAWGCVELNLTEDRLEEKRQVFIHVSKWELTGKSDCRKWLELGAFILSY